MPRSSFRRPFGMLVLLGSLAGAMALAGCGYQPLYGRMGATEQMAGVEVGNIAGRDGQMLRNRLLDRIDNAGRPAHPDYMLDVALATWTGRTDVSKSGNGTRERVQVTAHYTLRQSAGGKILTQGSSEVETSYSVPTSPYANLVSENDAIERGLDQLADQLTRRVALYLAGQRPSE